MNPRNEELRIFYTTWSPLLNLCKIMKLASSSLDDLLERALYFVKFMRYLFCFIHTLLRLKTANFCEIWTRIKEVEGERGDHNSTTIEQLVVGCSNAVQLVTFLTGLEKVSWFCTHNIWTSWTGDQPYNDPSHILSVVCHYPDLGLKFLLLAFN